MNVFSAAWGFLTDTYNWQGSGGIPTRLLQHLQYSGLALLLTVLVALPIGLLIGHWGHGGVLVSALATAGRALPTLGLVILIAMALGTGLLPVMVPLAAVGVPSVLLNTYEAVRAVDPGVTDAARGMGMRGWQVLLRAELPGALPLILVGVRTAAVQIVATTTIASYVGFGGLGRYITDGIANGIDNSLPEVAGGALLSALLAVAVLALFTGLSRLLVSPGVRGRRTTR
jgi:osmoprotectant transport system permease protein